MKKYQLRRFTTAGIGIVANDIDAIRRGEAINLERLLADDSITEVLTTDMVVEVQDFANRFECAKYLYELLEAYESEIDRDPERDKGLWTWLAVAWQEHLRRSGSDQFGDISRWIPSVDQWSRYYRHLLAGAWYVYRAHSDDPARTLGILCTQVQKPGEVFEQVIGRVEMVRSPSIVSAVTKLYLDPTTGTHKRGASGKGEGSARRFAAVLGQFDLTYDFFDMEVEDILQMLPREFDRYRS